MTTVLVLGAHGMLGRAVLGELRAGGLDVRPRTRADFDAGVDDPGALLAGPPGWVVNAIGLLRRRIDESDPASVDAAFAVNARFPHRLARAAAAQGWRVVHFSTDGVFSGAGGAPYDERARHDATDAYGRSKSAGEVQAPHVLNLRCSIVGPEPPPGRSLLAWVLGQPEGARVRGYANQLWNGLTTLHLARLVRAITSGATEPFSGTQHLVPADAASKATLVELIARSFGRADLEIQTMDAPRPTDLRLSTIRPEVNATLWRAAGYAAAPRIAAMVEELAAIVPGRSWPTTTS
jgi:dTDP-4-dehydrorhamnose reductase